MEISPHKTGIQAHYDKFAPGIDKWKRKNHYYYEHQKKQMRFLVGPGKKVLDLGCGTGELLNSLNPSHGVGVDISAKMIKTAQGNFPGLRFVHGDAEETSAWGDINGPFDYIILADIIAYLEDIQKTLVNLRPFCTPSTRIIFSYYNFLWEPILKFGEAMGIRTPQPIQNWLSTMDVENILGLADYEAVKKNYCLLVPKKIPLLSRYIELFESLPLLKYFCLSHYLVARPKPIREPMAPKTVSVIVPCMNESGNIEPLVKKTPEMGKDTEIIFVEGNSRDNTREAIRKVINDYPSRDIKFYVQKTKGKGDAVRLGFEKASGDILMILDADMTVPPGDLPKFYDAIVSGKGELINGTRLVYPMEKEAMRFFNLLGNKFFSMMFSWLLNQPIGDTLCGTKVLTRENYRKIAKGRDFFGDFDPFGDFDLLFGASKQNLRIVDLPVRYMARTYGETQIKRFRHGWLLIKMCLFAIKKLKLL